MSDEVIRVSTEWLALREPADAAARSRELVEHLASPATGRWVIHDLGGGSGAMGRWLAPLLDGLIVTLHESHIAWASYERRL